MRSIGTSIIVSVLAAATTGTGIPHDVKSIFESIVLAMDCDSDRAIRCRINGSNDDDWAQTLHCMNKFGNTKTCNCNFNAETFAITDSKSNMQKFEACCEDVGIDGIMACVKFVTRDLVVDTGAQVWRDSERCEIE